MQFQWKYQSPVLPPEPLKVAVTLFAAFMVSVQVPVPEHAPDQPAKLELLPGVAVRVTTPPSVNCAVVPQAAPAGLDETLP